MGCTLSESSLRLLLKLKATRSKTLMLSEVAEAVKVVENMGARVDWFDNVIGRILKAKDYQKACRKCQFHEGAYGGPSKAAGYPGG